MKQQNSKHLPATLAVLIIFLINSNAVAQNKKLIETRINTVKVDLNKRPITNASLYVLKDPNGKIAPDTMKITIKYEPQKGKRTPGAKIITVAEYNQKMRAIERKLNAEGYTLDEVKGIVKPIEMYKPVMKTDFTVAAKQDFAVVNTKLVAKITTTQFNSIMFKNRILPGLNIKPIPAYQLTKQKAINFKTVNPFKIQKSGGTYVKGQLLKSIKKPTSTNGNAKTATRRENYPFYKLGESNQLLSVTSSGYLESSAIAYQINADAEDATIEDIKNTASTYTVKGNINASGRVSNTTINIFDMTVEYAAKSNRNAKHSKKISLKIGGQEIIAATANIVDKEYSEEDVIVTDAFENTVEIPIMQFSIPIGIGDVKFEGGVRGTAGIDVTGEMHRTMAGLQIKPSASCGLYAEVGYAIGFGDFDIAVPYIEPVFNLIELNLDNYAEASLNWANEWQLYSDVSSIGTIELLKGHLYAGIKLGYPEIQWCYFVPCGVKWKQLDLRTELWKSQGLVQLNKTFIESKPEERFFESW